MVLRPTCQPVTNSLGTKSACPMPIYSPKKICVTNYSVAAVCFSVWPRWTVCLVVPNKGTCHAAGYPENLPSAGTSQHTNLSNPANTHRSPAPGTTKAERLASTLFWLQNSISDISCRFLLTVLLDKKRYFRVRKSAFIHTIADNMLYSSHPLTSENSLTLVS